MANSKWIPISQEEPPYNTRVIISCEHEGRKWVTAGMLEQSEDWDSDAEDDYYYVWRLDDFPAFFVRTDEVVRAWMPMPKPYEESEE